MRPVARMFASAVLLAALLGSSARGEDKLELRKTATMREILAERVGKRATLRLQSGEDLNGTVVAVGDSLVHLTRLAGKDYFDAVVSIDRVSAVVMQMRGR